MFALDLFNNDHERRLTEGAVDQLEQRRIDDLAMKMDDLVARAKTATTPEVKQALMKEFQKCKAERNNYYKIQDECIGYGTLTGEGQVTPTATGLRHHAKPENYGGYEPEPELKGLNKTLTKNLEKGMGVEFKRAKKYQGGIEVDEAGIPGNVPADKIPGKEDLLKGKGRSYYESVEEGNASKKVFKDKSGKPVGEIGIDPESSPGNGEWYVYHYGTGYSVVGFDSAAEAKRELLYVHKHPEAVEGHESTFSEAGIPGSVPTNKIPGKEALLKGRGRSYYEAQDQKKNSKVTEDQRLSVGDPIVVTAPNEFEGKTGEISDLSPSGKFVVVDLYNHGRHSMHLSDVEYNQYAADQEDEDDWYDDQEDTMEGSQDFNKVEPYAVCLAGKPVKKFDYYEDARRFHDNWKKKLYNQGDKTKADKITLMPLNLEEFAPGGTMKPPAPPTAKKKDPFEDDDRSQLLMSIKNLLDKGAKIDSYLFGARGHITGVANDYFGFYFKKLNKPHSKSSFVRPMDGQDDESYMLKLVKPGYYQLWDKSIADAGEQGVAEGEISQQYTVAVDCGEDGTFTVKVHAGDKGEALRKAQKIVRNEYDTYPEGARIVGQGVAEGDPNAPYTPSPAKPFRNPPGFNKQGTGVGNRLADLNRAELANIQPSKGTPVPGKEFAQGVLKDLKKVNVKEIKADPTGSWVVYGGSRVMKFKTHGGAKAYAEKNGGKVASSEFYADKIQKQGVAEASYINGHVEDPESLRWKQTSMSYEQAVAKFGKNNVKQDGKNRLGQKIVMVLVPLGEQAETDYSKRRQRERDVDAGKPVARQRQSKMTDYQKRRAQQKKEMELGESQDTSGVEQAILHRIMVAHTDLLKQFGPEKVMQAAEEVAYNVGDVDEIGTSDVSAWVHEVNRILGA